MSQLDERFPHADGCASWSSCGGYDCCDPIPCDCDQRARIADVLADLDLLQRCRDAVVALVKFRRNDGAPWWLQDADDLEWCGVCGRFDAADGIVHAAGCPAVTTDVLAKEVRGE